MKNTLLLSLALLSSPALADGLTFTSVTCGDHWFTVTATLDSDAQTGVVTFSGDGVSDDAAHLATVSNDGNVVIALDGRGDALIVDDFDAVHGIYWGSYRQGAHVTSLGLCGVQ